MPTTGAHIVVSFDGGFNKVACAAGAFFSSTWFRQRRIGGNARSAYLAEVVGARLAIELVIELLKHNPHITHVVIRGDNFAVIHTLASDTAPARAVPGKSPAPKAWAAIVEQLDKLDAVLRGRAQGVTIEFQWVPRRFNVNADELCRACMEDRTPVIRSDAPEPPRVFTPPTDAMLEKLARKILTSPPTSIRSLPPFLKPLWHQALAHCASWNNGPLALLLAPRVLLARRSHGRQDDLRERLARYAKAADLVEREFWFASEDADDDERPHAASDGDNDGDQPRTAARLSNNDVRRAPDETHDHLPRPAASEGPNWELIGRVAAQAPARAVKMLGGRLSLRSDAQAVAQLREKRCAPPSAPLPPPDGVPKPRWISASLIAATAATGLARLAAPGADGWTRELVLASICKGTAAAWEVLVNAIAHGDPVSGTLGLQPHLDPCLAARVAMWPKTTDSDKLRIIGMTSTVAKIAWRAVLQATVLHLPNQALTDPGGVHAITRWADRLDRVFTSDVVDAYWGVRRPVVLNWLIEHKHPAAWLFWRTYGSHPSLELGGHLHPLERGVLPGCGGAAFAFAIDMHVCLGGVPARLYADDGTCASVDDFVAFARACAAADKHLAKGLLIDPTAPSSAVGTRSVLEGIPLTVSHAGRVLGAFIGATEAAIPLFRAHIHEKLRKLDAIACAKVPLQAKWQMTRSVERSVIWDATATRPEVFLHVADEIDAAFQAHLSRVFLPPGTVLGHKSMELIYTPQAHGGLGMMPFTAESSVLYSLTSAQLNGKPSHEDPDAMRARLDVREVRRRHADAQIEKSTARDIRLGRRRDESVAWFDIQAVTSKTTIDDESFSLGVANHIDATLPLGATYKTCSASITHASVFDHSQCCHRCAGPMRYPRHQRVQQEFLACAVSYGVVASTNFFALGAQPTGKRPDAIVYRGATQQCPLVLDFAVVHQAPHFSYSAANKIYQQKIVKYRRYLAINSHQDVVEVAPIVVSTRGVFHPKSLAFLKEIGLRLATRKGFAYEAVRRMKLAVIMFEPLRRSSIALRHAAGTLDQQWVNSDSESNDDDDVTAAADDDPE